VTQLCKKSIKANRKAVQNFRSKSFQIVIGVVLLLGSRGLAQAQVLQASGSLKGLTLEELMDIEVTSVSRSEGTVGQSPAAVFVMTPEMIRRSGATTFPELFRMVPGMDVARIDGNKWAISARGFNQRFQDKLLVQVDGRTLYTPAFSGVYWDTVDYPLDDIERIEIIRGPGASVWGANAVNGIINIITKSAKDTQGGFVSGGVGTTEQGFGTFRYGGKVGESLFYRLYGKGFTRDQTFAEVGDPHDGWWSGRGGLRLDWKPSEQNTMTFDGSYLRSVAGRRDERAQTTAPFSFLNLENEITDAGHVLGRWTRQLDEENKWSVQAYWDHFSRLADNLPVRLRVDTYDVEFQHQFPIRERQKIVYGVGYRYTDTFIGSSGRDGGFALTFQPSNGQFHLFSALLQDQIGLVPEKLELTLGSKFEHNDFTGFEVQPTARLLWTPTPRQSVWAAASRAVRTPNLSEDSGRATLLPSSSPPIYPRTTPNRDFQSEELMAYELGYRVQATAKLAADLASFYHEYDNLRVSVPGGTFTDASGATIRPLLVQNGMKGETYGAELGVQWQATESWRLHAAYTRLKMNLHRRAGLAASAEAAEGQSPQHQVYLRSAWDLPGHLEFDLIGRFVDKLSGFNPGGAGDTIAAYVSLDARLAWHPRENLTLSLGGQNLLDNHHPEFGTSTRVNAPVAEPRRGVYGKVTFWW
jgi:iron complex outermembrane receptor protein